MYSRNRFNMFNLNKKGELSTEEIAGLVIAIIGGLIIVVFVVLPLVGYLSPESSSLGCGLNVRVRSATIEASLGTAPAPIYMCSQYNTPIDINAANFKACPGIADFCGTTKDKAVLYQCYQQCARIQVDNLVDSCWSMAGSGNSHLWSAWGRLLSVGQGIIDALKLAWDVNTVPFKFSPLYNIIAPGWGTQNPFTALQNDINNLFKEKAAILRCFRFQVVNPAVIPGTSTKQPARYYDYTLGHSWSYNITDAKVCTPSVENPICSFGGEGVKYINEMGEAKYNIFGLQITIPKDAAQLAAGELLAYNMSARQICYISYYEYEPGQKRTAVSCNSWSEYAGSSQYVN